MKGSKNAVLALLGLGALAYWKFKKSSPEEQDEIKEKFNVAKDNLNKWGSEAKSKAEELANKAKSKADELASAAQNKVQDVAEDVKSEAGKVENKLS